jgi:hypothetical protein
VLGLQVQRFVEQQQVSLKWITQGLLNSGRRRSKLSPSSNPAITIQKVTRANSTNVLDEGLRIREIGHRMNLKIKSVKQGVYRK